jgi:hypothetical protein
MMPKSAATCGLSVSADRPEEGTRGLVELGWKAELRKSHERIG